MAVYTLPREEKWPQGLARVIQSYMQGQEIKRQRDLQRQQMALASEKERREQQKAQSDIRMKEVYMNLLRALGGGGQAEGPPAEGGGYPVLPGLEGGAGARVSGWGPGGPRVEFQKPKTEMDIIRDISAIALQISKLPEGSPQRKLAEATMMKMRDQLGEMQGMNKKVTPAKPRSILGIDIPFTEIPEKTEYVPRKRVESREVKPTEETPLLTGKEVPEEYRKLGVDRYRAPEGLKTAPARRPTTGRSIGEEVDELIKTGKAGVMSRPSSGFRKPPVVPQQKSYKMPPKPESPEELKSWENVSSIFFKLPTSVQLEIWKGYSAGLTWNQIEQSDDLKRYIK